VLQRIYQRLVFNSADCFTLLIVKPKIELSFLLQRFENYLHFAAKSVSEIVQYCLRKICACAYSTVVGMSSSVGFLFLYSSLLPFCCGGLICRLICQLLSGRCALLYLYLHATCRLN